MTFPHTLTPELVDELCATVKAGNFRYMACRRAGISPSTFNSWLHRGKKEMKAVAAGVEGAKLTLQAELVKRLDQAEAECHATLLRDVLDADDPRLKMDFLKARYNKLYSKNPNAHVDDETGEETKRDALDVLADKLRLLMEDE